MLLGSQKLPRRQDCLPEFYALTLAKMPFVDQERLNDIYLPPAKISAILRLARQRQRLEADIASRKKRILSIIDGYIPGIRQTFSNTWS